MTPIAVSLGRSQEGALIKPAVLAVQALALLIQKNGVWIIRSRDVISKGGTDYSGFSLGIR